MSLISEIKRDFFSFVSPKPMAYFRVAFTLVILAELVHIVLRRDLFFLEFPLAEQVPTTIYYHLAFWSLSLCCLLVGLLTPFVALVNYIYIVHFFRPDAIFSYHADMIYVEVAFISLFLPLNRSLSVDSFLIKKFFKIDLTNYFIPRLYYNLTILFCIGFMYFDSTFYKLDSEFWTKGLGFWLPASFPSFTVFDWDWLLNYEWLVKFAGYLTLFFEAIFIFVFWIPIFRPWVLLIGFFLHFGIGFVFPIPLFGLIMLALYINFFPLNQSSEFPPILSFDRYMVRILAVIVLILGVFQLNLIFPTYTLGGSTYTLLQDKFGVTRHTVFGKWQFSVMKSDIALIYYHPTKGKEWLPVITDKGYIGSEVYSRFWSFWWSNSLKTDEQNQQRWARVAEAWAKRKGVNLNEGYISVQSRPVVIDSNWEKNRHRRHQNLEWTEVARIRWNENKRQIFIGSTYDFAATTSKVIK